MTGNKHMASSPDASNSSETSPGSGLVSVIVPCFNTARYLDDCSRSLDVQTYHKLEILVVDDGSTDSTPEAIRGWAERDVRVTVINQKNQGLGAARNSGLAVASGEFLTFLDGDDMLPADAIQRMVDTIRRTKSDFVSGVADRFDGERQWRASLYRRGFGEDLEATHVYERPSLLNDHIVCSKLYRRSFWTGHGFSFPEGTLFEDIEVATRAHCLAQSVDLLAEPTYLWRSRPLGDVSITQDRRRPGSVSARFAALGAVDIYLRENAPLNVWRRHGMKLVAIDVVLYARELSGSDDLYAAEFFAAAGPVLAAMSPAARDSLGPMEQVLYRAVLSDDDATSQAMTTLLKSRNRVERLRALRSLNRYDRRTVLAGMARRLLRL